MRRIYDHRSYVGMYFVVDVSGQIMAFGLTLREALTLVFTDGEAC